MAAPSTAPKWAKYRTDMASEFPSPFRGTDDPLAHQIEKFVERLDKLRPEKGGPAYLGKSGALAYKYPDVKNVEIPEKMGDLDEVLDDVVKLFEGARELGKSADDVQCHPASRIPRRSSPRCCRRCSRPTFWKANTRRTCTSPNSKRRACWAIWSAGIR